MASLVKELYQISEEKIISTQQKFFQDTEMEVILLNSFYKASITDTKTRKRYHKKTTNNACEHKCILKKSLANRLQQYIKRSLNMTKWGLSEDCSTDLHPKSM